MDLLTETNAGPNPPRRMPAALAGLISPPVFPGDEDKTIAALLAHYGILFSLGFNAVVLPALLLAGEPPLRTTVMFGTITAFLLAHRAFLQRGHVYGSTAVFLALAWCVIAVVNYLEGGFRNPGFMVQLVFIIIVGFILGGRWAFVVAACASLLAVGFFILEGKGMMPAPPGGGTDVSTLVKLCAIMFATAALLALLVGRMRGFIAAHRRELLARREAERQLERHRDDLEDAVRQRTEGLAQANEELRRDREFIAQLMETSPVGIVVVDDQGGFIFANAAAEQILHRPRAEIIRLGVASSEWGFSDQRGQPLLPEELPFIRVARSGMDVRNAPLMIRTPDDRVVQLLVNASPLGGDGGQTGRCVSTITDVTEVHRLEQEMHRTQKLESVGVLAGGIAHDFNNLLTAIMGNISLAQLGQRAGSPAAEALEEAEKASSQARDLTQQLLTFARGGRPLRQPVAIGQVAAAAVRLALRGTKVRGEFHLPPDLWAVEGDPGQLAQAFHNLGINAFQAMASGGTVTVGAANVVLDKGCDIPLPPGGYVKVTVSDHGPGIPEAVKDRIFVPFFTTKKEGTGIGLAVVRSIVTDHGGHIHAESVEGEGATFTLHLRASMKLPVDRVEQRSVHEGRGRVLVMDDEPVVRSTSSKMLAALGFEVDAAADGEEAVRAYRDAVARDERYDVVILDLTVPGGMGGVEALQRLLEIDPGVKAVVSSGYSETPDITRHRELGFCHFLAKPYLISTLSRVMQEVCGIAPAARLPEKPPAPAPLNPADEPPGPGSG